MIDAILTLNVGSSSLKYAAFAAETTEEIVSGKVDWVGDAATLSMTGREDQVLAPGADHVAALRAIMTAIADLAAFRIVACAHRIVHGGDEFSAPIRLDRKTLARLSVYEPFAPLHQGKNLAAAEIMIEAYPDVVHVGCFDTAFHQTIDEETRAYALPETIREKGVKRYGFHGLNYEWIAQALAENRPDLYEARVVVAHLGSGASLCAMTGGRSVATTMGLTALDGLPMGTRCGAVDPGAVIYMIRDLGLGPDRAEEILYRESGLLGLSGVSNDLRELRASTDPRADLAIRYFEDRVAEQIAALAARLGGIDAVVFTGGIGEHDDGVRGGVLQRLAFLGPIDTEVIPANEERVMCGHARAVLQSTDDQHDPQRMQRSA